MIKGSAAWIVGSAFLLLLLGGCDSYLVKGGGADSTTLDSAALDATVDATVDGAVDSTTLDSAALDATVDATVDGAVDSTVDAGGPVGDGTVDGAVDSTVDTGGSVGDGTVDGAVDSTVDTGGPVADATVDSTVDAGGPVGDATVDSTVDGSGVVTFMTGVNLAGGAFGSSLPGTYGVDYIYPTQAEVDYFVGKGMNVFRLPFRWERLQHQANGSFDSAELARIEDFVSYATGLGTYVLLDPHNYARYYGQVIGQGTPTAAFTDFWTKLADHFKSNPLIIFGLMNEPHDMTTELWRDDANAAIQAIRATGATNLILVPGNGWTGAHSWNASYYGTPNGTVMQTIVDPGNNFAFEAHQYLDGDSSGTSDTCVSVQVGVDRLQDFTAWLQQHGYKGFLGEFGAADNSTCLTAMDNMLSHIDTNKDVWIGWTYWAAGPWWGNYMFSIEPQGGQDAPQMATLADHL